MDCGAVVLARATLRPTTNSYTITGLTVNNDYEVRVTPYIGSTAGLYQSDDDPAGSYTFSTTTTLSALTVSDGSLSPSFSTSVTDYTVEVDYDVDSITVTATPSETDSPVPAVDIDFE